MPPAGGGEAGTALHLVPSTTRVTRLRPLGAAGPRAYPRPCGAPAAAGVRSGQGGSSFSLLLPRQVIKGNGGSGSLESLDFFGRKEEAPLGSAEEGWGLTEAGEQQKEDGAGKNSGEVAGKRKRTAESSGGKRKKKKARGIYIHMLVSLPKYLMKSMLLTSFSSLQACRCHRSFHQGRRGFWVLWVACVRADKIIGVRFSVKAWGCGCHPSGVFINFTENKRRMGLRWSFSPDKFLAPFC